MNLNWDMEIIMCELGIGCGDVWWIAIAKSINYLLTLLPCITFINQLRLTRKTFSQTCPIRKRNKTLKNKFLI